jgi:tripartite-type tricarboxylate transporter receptor subunit TctC
MHPFACGRELIRSRRRFQQLTEMLARSLTLLAAMMTAGLPFAAALAQDWPTRPVTMVVPFAAGGGADLLGRIIAPGMSEFLGEQVIVENVGGAGGVTGSYRVVKAPPDGYQFVLGSSGTHSQSQSLYKNPLYNAATDFAPVMLVIEQPIMLIARRDLPVANLAEFIAYTKANHDKMQFGSAGTGAAVHLACVLLNAAIGVKVTHIPYRGTGPAMQDLIGGRIDYQCPVASAVVPQVESNQVKAIAVLTKQRAPNLPDLATAQEQGLVNFEAGIWFALFLPKGTPASIVQKLQRAALATVDTPSVQEKLRAIGGLPIAPERRTSEYLGRFVASEIEKWAAPIKASGVSAD